MPPQKPMTYAGSGVDYGAMDPFKRMAIRAARSTAPNIERLGFRVIEKSYGESAFLIEPTDTVPYLTAHVEEGLGTKYLVADAMHRLTGKSYDAHVAQDTVAMIVNDVVTQGALPLSVAMHLAVGESKWFDNIQRSQDLIEGWKRSCDLARCAWGGGETPTLKGIVMPGTAVLSGSAVGVVKPIDRIIKSENICSGDAIFLVESSGIHANGLTMCRDIAAKISKDPERPDLGYLVELNDGRTYGEALLDPTHIYVGFVEDCINAGIDIHYVVNVTGHGWRKLMRATETFAYVIERLPKATQIFEFIQEHGSVTDREAYGNFNMRVGFVFYIPDSDVDKAVDVASSNGLVGFRAGYIEQSEEKKVVIEPKGGLTYTADTLAVR